MDVKAALSENFFPEIFLRHKWRKSEQIRQQHLQLPFVVETCSMLPESASTNDEDVVAAETALVTKLRQRGSCSEGFREMDYRGDGVVSAEELHASAAKLFGLDIPLPVAARIIGRYAAPSREEMVMEDFCEMWDGHFTRWATANDLAQHGFEVSVL